MIPRQRGTMSFFCGPVRSGKTFAIDEICKAENRIVRFDVTGELSQADDSWTHIYASPAQCFRVMRANPYYFRIAYHPAADLKTEFEYISKAMWRIDANKILVCDEFHEVCGVHDTPVWVRTMLRYMRHAHIELLCASQRIADVSKLLTSGADTIVLFKTHEFRDMQAIEDRWPLAADMMLTIRQLKYNDITKKVSQIPQAIVVSRTEGTTKIYDFKTGGFITKSSRDNDEEITSMEPAADIASSMLTMRDENDEGAEPEPELQGV